MKVCAALIGIWFFVQVNAQGCTCPDAPVAVCSDYCGIGTACNNAGTTCESTVIDFSQLGSFSTATTLMTTVTTKIQIDFAEPLDNAAIIRAQDDARAAVALESGLDTGSIEVTLVRINNRRLLNSMYKMIITYKDISDSSANMIVSKGSVSLTNTIASHTNASTVMVIESPAKQLQNGSPGGTEGEPCVIWADIYCHSDLNCVDVNDGPSGEGVCKLVLPNTTGLIGYLEGTIRFKYVRPGSLSKSFLKYILKNHLMLYGFAINLEYMSIEFHQPSLTVAMTLITDELKTAHDALAQAFGVPELNQSSTLLLSLQSMYSSIFANYTEVEIIEKVTIVKYPNMSLENANAITVPEGLYWDESLITSTILFLVIAIAAYYLIDCIRWPACSCCFHHEKAHKEELEKSKRELRAQSEIAEEGNIENEDGKKSQDANDIELHT